MRKRFIRLTVGDKSQDGDVSLRTAKARMVSNLIYGDAISVASAADGPENQDGTVSRACSLRGDVLRRQTDRLPDAP